MSVTAELETRGARVVWRSRLATLALLLMEVFALFVLGSLLAGIGGRSGPSVLSLLAAAFGGFGLVKLLRRFDFSRRVLVYTGSFISILGLWLLWSLQYGDQPFDPSALGMLLSDPALLLNRHTPEVFGGAVIGLAWVRGGLIATRDEITHRAVLASLTAGLGIVVIGLSIGRAAAGSRAMDGAALPFFSCGLLALALVQLSQSQHIQGDSWRGPWFLVLVGTIAGMALIGAVFGLLPLDTINSLLAPVGAILLLAIDLLLYFLVLPIVIVFNWALTHLLSGRLHPVDFRPQTLQQASQQLQRPGHPSGLAMLLINAAHLLLVIIIAAIVGLVLIWIFHLVEREQHGELTEREPVESEGALRSDLQGLLAALRRRLRGRERPVEPPLPPKLLALRRLYLSLLHHAEARGVVREPATTPREFAPVLQDRLASQHPAELSTTFAHGRYGLIEPTDEELRTLEDESRQFR